jgi:hypothetical protein
MPLLAFNITGAPATLAAGNPARTLPASASPPGRGKPVDVTSELRPNLTVDPANGKAGGLTGANVTAIQEQAASIVLEWTSDPEYLTDALVVSGPTAGLHAPTHNAGGGDVLAIDAAAGTGSLRTIGVGALQACAGDDGRLTNSRTPTAHAASHAAGLGDPITVTPAQNAVADAQGLGALSVIRVPTANWLFSQTNTTGTHRAAARLSDS